MELIPTVIGAGYAAGINAYGTVLLLGLLGQAGFGEVPDQLTSDGVLIAAGVMYAIEFVTDKVPYLDNTWDLVHTFIRPAIGSVIGVEFADLDGAVGAEEVLAGGSAGGTAFASHAVKTGLRLGVNASPEPFSNIFISLGEDGLVAVVVALVAQGAGDRTGVVVIVLLAIGIGLVLVLRKRDPARAGEAARGEEGPDRGGTAARATGTTPCPRSAGLRAARAGRVLGLGAGGRGVTRVRDQEGGLRERAEHQVGERRRAGRGAGRRRPSPPPSAAFISPSRSARRSRATLPSRGPRGRRSGRSA